MENENDDGNKIFDRAFIKRMREIRITDARPVSLKKALLFVVDRCAQLEGNLQQQIDELKGVKK